MERGKALLLGSGGGADGIEGSGKRALWWSALLRVKGGSQQACRRQLFGVWEAGHVRWGTDPELPICWRQQLPLAPGDYVLYLHPGCCLLFIEEVAAVVACRTVALREPAAFLHSATHKNGQAGVGVSLLLSDVPDRHGPTQRVLTF
jgi:hypothetical protein